MEIVGLNGIVSESHYSQKWKDLKRLREKMKGHPKNTEGIGRS